MTDETKLRWRPIILLSVAIGVGVGLLSGITQTFFDIQLPPAFGSVIAGVIIGVATSRYMLTRG